MVVALIKFNNSVFASVLWYNVKKERKNKTKDNYAVTIVTADHSRIKHSIIQVQMITQPARNVLSISNYVP